MAGGHGRVFGFVVLILLMAISAPAVGHFLPHSDPDDMPGHKFDLRRVSLAEGARPDGTPTIELELWTHGAFQQDDFAWTDSSRPFFLVNLDTRGDRDVDFSVIMGVNDEGTYCQIQPSSGRYKDGRPAMKPGYFRCRFARRKVNPDDSHIRWKFSSWSRRAEDSAPDRGWFVH